MNIVEALKIAKEQGKKVRPVGEDWFVKFDKEANTHIKKWRDSDIDSTILTIKHTLADWEVVKEKPNKETQYKIDSMKFQIVRHCKNRYSCMECRLAKKCERDGYMSCNYAPKKNLLDNWSLKEIVEAYHILKKVGEI